MKMRNSKQNFLLILMVLVHSATSYYLDSASFMNSTPGVTCGSVVTSDGAGQEKIIFFDASEQSSFQRRLLQGSNRYQTYYGNKDFYQNRYFNSVARMTEKDYWQSLSFIRESNKSPETRAMRNLYRILRIPTQQIEEYLVPYQNMLLQQIDRWFAQKLNPEIQAQSLLALKIKVQSLKDTSDYLTNKYLKGINMIILGQNNKVNANAKKIFISADNMNVNANKTFVYSGAIKNNKVQGNNIVRTKRYQFNFDKIDMIQQGNVKDCISIIS